MENLGKGKKRGKKRKKEREKKKGKKRKGKKEEKKKNEKVAKGRIIGLAGPCFPFPFFLFFPLFFPFS